MNKTQMILLSIHNVLVLAEERLEQIQCKSIEKFYNPNFVDSEANKKHMVSAESSIKIVKSFFEEKECD